MLTRAQQTETPIAIQFLLQPPLVSLNFLTRPTTRKRKTNKRFKASTIPLWMHSELQLNSPPHIHKNFPAVFKYIMNLRLKISQENIKNVLIQKGT